MTTKSFCFLLLTLIAIVYVPYFGAYIAEHGNLEKYFFFPPIEIPPNKPGFNLFVTICVAIIFLIFLLLYLFPRLFGFSKVSPLQIQANKKLPLPIWFWLGLITWAGTLIFLIARLEEPKWFANWALVPLFWGFTLLLDGIVYRINNGESMLSKRPTELFAMALVSISGWLVFEYMNFFINLNWVYPQANKVGHDEFILYAILGSSGFIPMCFEWYQLLRKVKVLSNKYENGPKIKFPRWVSYTLLILFILFLFYTPFKPENFFYMVWMAPMFIIAIVLELMGIWTPFTPIKQKGDWTALLVFALTFLIQGLLLECWNYLSADHSVNPVFTANPAYWQYCIPFIPKWCIFEMPVLGYAGYLFFSIHCWLWWIIFARLMNVDTQFSDQPDFR